MTAGSMIAEARAARALSIDDLAASLRIRASILRLMEADDFSACGGSVYARGHLRSIARILDLDPAELLAAYEAQEGAE